MSHLLLADPHTSCPACNSIHIKTRWHKLNGYHQQRQWQVDLCSDCRFNFVNPPPTSETLSTYYNDDYYLAQEVQDGVAQMDAPLAYYQTFVTQLTALINHLHPEAKKIHEIGCANGYVLNLMRAAGYEVSGSELSETTSRFAREQFGLDVRGGAFIPEPNRWDVIYLSHVLEHVPDPYPLIDAAAQSLRPNGILVVVGPNAASFNSRLYGRYCSWVIPPLHVSYFTPESFHALYNHTGLHPIYDRTVQGMGIDPFTGAMWALLAASGRKQQLKAKTGGINTNTAQTGKTTSKIGQLQTIILGSCRMMYRVTRPIWRVAEQKLSGEELWSVGRKPAM